MTTTQFDSKLTNFFNAHIFSKVWNLPRFEFRKNIIPEQVSKPVATGYVRLRQSSFALPTELDPYLVYAIPTKFLGGIKLSDMDEWMKLDAFQASTRVELRVHTDDGVMFPRGSMYLCPSPETGALLLAVDKVMFNTVLSQQHSTKDIIVALYYDSDVVNNLTIDSRIIDGADPAVLFAAAQLADIVFMNGKYVQLTDVSEIEASGYIEFVTDENITASFEVDLAMTGERRNFVSTLDDHVKTIVHIPKSANEENAVISHHTCDMYLMPRNLEDSHLKGTFLHRAVEPYPMTQVTHNDFGITEVVLNAYIASLGADELKLVVHVRNHSKDNLLIPEKNRIAELYTHDDETILDFMEGQGPADFEFWTAAHLEASNYTKMISDVPNLAKLADLPQIIDALGYYNALALISDRVYTTNVPAVDQHQYVLPVPVIFDTKKVATAVFINGTKLDNDMVTVIRIKGSFLLMAIDEDVLLNEGDRLHVELYEDLPHGILKIIPEASFDTVELLSDMFVLYEEVTPVTPVEGIDQTYPKTYVLTDPEDAGAVADVQGVLTMTFDVGSYGKTFILTFNEGLQTISQEVDAELIANNPIVIDLSTRITELVAAPPLVLDEHTDKTESTGTIIDTDDPDALDTHPAWHLVDGNTDYDLAHRWVAQLSSNSNIVEYTLDPTLQTQYYMLGFRIGAMPDMNDAVRAAEMPINYDVLIDGVIVEEVRNEWWYKNPQPIHTHLFNIPILVDSVITLRILPVQSGGTLYVSTDLWEPIFSGATVETTVPLVGDISGSVFINGNELVPEIDYRIVDIQDPAQPEGSIHFSGRQLVVNNVAFLEDQAANLHFVPDFFVDKNDEVIVGPVRTIEDQTEFSLPANPTPTEVIIDGGADETEFNGEFYATMVDVFVDAEPSDADFGIFLETTLSNGDVHKIGYGRLSAEHADPGHYFDRGNGSWTRVGSAAPAEWYLLWRTDMGDLLGYYAPGYYMNQDGSAGGYVTSYKVRIFNNSTTQEFTTGFSYVYLRDQGTYNYLKLYPNWPPEEDPVNTLEAYITHHEVAGKTAGYRLQDLLGKDGDHMMWKEPLSTVTVGGERAINVAPMIGTVKAVPERPADSNPHDPVGQNWAVTSIGAVTLPQQVGDRMQVIVGPASSLVYTRDDIDLRLDGPFKFLQHDRVPIAEPDDGEQWYICTLEMDTGDVVKFGYGISEIEAPDRTPRTWWDLGDGNGWRYQQTHSPGPDMNLHVTRDEDGIHQVRFGPDGDEDLWKHNDSPTGFALEGTVVKLTIEFINTSVDDDFTIEFDHITFYDEADGGRVPLATLPGEVFRKGAPYCTRTPIPPRGKQFIDRFHTNEDEIAILEQLGPYFQQLPEEPTGLIVIPYSHRIASLFATIVMRDILNGSLVVAIDPDDARMLEQLADYDYLRQYDVALDVGSAVDLNYVDVQPMYVQAYTADTSILALVNRLSAIILADNVVNRSTVQE